MKLRSLLMLAAMGGLTVACQNEDVAGVDRADESGKMVVSLSLGKAETKALGVSAAGLYNNINDLQMFFYNAQNVQVLVPMTGSADDADKTGYENQQALVAAVAALTNGEGATHKHDLVIKGVPASVSRVYMVANMPATPIDASSLTAAKNTVVYLSEQNTTDFEVFSGENSTLTDVGTVVAGAEEGVATVDVDLKPVPSRIEIGDFRAMELPDWDGVDIASFEVKGIYINSFYPAGKLDPEATQEEADRIDNADDADKYSAEAYSQISYNNQTIDYSFMCDDYTAGYGDPAEVAGAESTTAGVIYEVAPVTENYYWGYQILQGVMPEIVVELEVAFDNNTTATKYLTVTKYLQGARDVAVQEAARGNVYRIDHFDFDVTDLEDTPYEGTKTLTAHVTVAPWVLQTIRPNFN